MSEDYYLVMFVTGGGSMPTVAVKWNGNLTEIFAYQTLLLAGVLEIEDEIVHVDRQNLEDFTVDEAIQAMAEFYWELKAHEEQSQ